MNLANIKMLDAVTCWKRCDDIRAPSFLLLLSKEYSNCYSH